MQNTQPRTPLIAILSLGTLPGCELGPHGDGKLETSSSTETSETNVGMPTTTVAPPGEGSASTDEGPTTVLSATETSTSTSTPEPVCGNGIPEGEEQCDDGDANNGPGNACTSTCMNNTCGDGELGPSDVEECDDGNREPGDLCSASCKRQHVVFVTAGRVNGAMQPGNSGKGLKAADAICQIAAENAQFLPPDTEAVFKAWLVVGRGSIADRFMGGLTGTLNPIVTRSGDIVAPNWQGLISGQLLRPINVTETKSILGVRNTEWVWTNADSAGKGISNFDCGEWGNSELTDTVTIGSLLEKDQGWTQYEEQPGGCEFFKHLYCFSQ